MKLSHFRSIPPIERESPSHQKQEIPGVAALVRGDGGEQIRPHCNGWQELVHARVSRLREVQRRSWRSPRKINTKQFTLSVVWGLDGFHIVDFMTSQRRISSRYFVSDVITRMIPQKCPHKRATFSPTAFSLGRVPRPLFESNRIIYDWKAHFTNAAHEDFGRE
jgi:hypothetical protein